MASHIPLPKSNVQVIHEKFLFGGMCGKLCYPNPISKLSKKMCRGKPSKSESLKSVVTKVCLVQYNVARHPVLQDW